MPRAVTLESTNPKNIGTVLQGGGGTVSAKVLRWERISLCSRKKKGHVGLEQGEWWGNSSYKEHTPLLPHEISLILMAVKDLVKIIIAGHNFKTPIKEISWNHFFPGKAEDELVSFPKMTNF